MQINELNENRLRELAGIHADGDSRVLSVFLNLDPAEFATPPARASEISSVIDDAHRRARESNGLSHDARRGLEEDVERAATFLRDLSPKGAHGFALFACAATGLFEGIRLPRPIETRAVINDAPFVEPLIELLGSGGNWMVVLVNRQTGRLLRGDRNQLEELPAIEDDVHGQHSQGGWSQARYQRSVDEDVMDHLKNVADAVFLRFKRASFDHLLLGGPGETRSDFEGRLHPYLRERLAGWIDIDVENSTADDVAKCAGDKIAEHTRGTEREALDRLQEAVAKNGRGAAGLEQTLGALNERRVETLLLMENVDAAGCTCPQCGSVYATDGGSCPADGTELECRDNVIENAMHLALEQSAGVLVVRDEDNARELESHGGIAAVLRF
jgi:peptide chain release factor subunit 1